MFPINPTILADARAIAQQLLDHNEPPEGIYPVPVGARVLHLSADPKKILGPDTVEVDGTIFYLGFRRNDLQP